MGKYPMSLKLSLHKAGKWPKLVPITTIGAQFPLDAPKIRRLDFGVDFEFRIYVGFCNFCQSLDFDGFCIIRLIRRARRLGSADIA